MPKDTFDPWDFIDSYQLQSAGRAQPDLIKQFAKRNGEMVDWMMELQPDITAVSSVCTIQPGSDYNYKKGYFWTYPATLKLGSGVFESSGAFCTASVDKGIEASPDSQALDNTAAVVLVKQDGKVTGAIVKDNESGAYKQINAKVGVVLAMGDFSANSDMYNALCTEVQECNPYTQLVGSGRDGYGIKMGIWAGGVMEIGPRAAMGGATSALPMGFFGAAAGCWINKYGKRFCNEAYGGPLLSGCAVARQPGDIIYSVWDSDWKTVLLNQIAGHLALKNWDEASVDQIGEYMEAAKGTGADGDDTSGKYLFCADTLEELFSYMGMEEGVAKNAIAEIEAWNAAHDAGLDEEFGRDPEMLWPIATPPFYGFVCSKRVGGGSLVATSGLLCTGEQQVQGQGFEPIKGLYACGNTCGGRFPMGYNGIMNGVSIGMCLTLGYTLGEFLATGDLDEATTLGKNNAEPKQSDKGMGPGPMPGGDAEGEAAEGEAPAEGGDAPAGEGAAAEGEAPAGEAAPEK